MAQFDLPLEELRGYRPPRDEPPDFDAFWSSTIENSRRVRSETRFVETATRLRTIATADVTFSGFAGQPIRAWLQWPRDAQGPLPTVVQFLGYGGGRGQPTDWLFWASTGFAHFVMDTRGQGGEWRSGDTSDIVDGGTGSQSPGVMTRGILDPATYYYRRLIADAVLAVESAAEHPIVDGDRIVVAGVSQGGGLSLAAAALARRPTAALVDVPFLCHFRRALEVCDTDPYAEIRRFLRVHRREEERVFRTLSYVDGRSFAARAGIPALFSVGLEDEITPPSTVFAAYNDYAGPKEIRVWSFSGHEAPYVQHDLEQLAFLAGLGLP
ncbi:MAG TPA: acetylxylan esterase [Candidatus Limnocylindrales bacterium]|jgi:cephalosporin-C deacetylase